MISSIKAFLFCMLANSDVTSGQDLRGQSGERVLSSSNLQIVGSLQTWGIDDGRPAEGSAKQAVWLGDWNGDGGPPVDVPLMMLATSGTVTAAKASATSVIIFGGLFMVRVIGMYEIIIYDDRKEVPT